MDAASRDFRSRSLAIGHSAEGARYAGIGFGGSHLCSFGNCCKRRGDYLRGPSGPGEIRCGHRLRTDGNYGSRFRRRLNFRRTWNDPGTVLGLFAIVILQNGLRLSAQPSELAGILMGVLLVGTILLDRLSKRSRNVANRTIQFRGGRSDSQVAVLSGVILAGALDSCRLQLAVGAFLRQEPEHLRCPEFNPTNDRKTVIAMMPKAKGDPYFISCKLGAEEAAKELGVELLWDGPTDLDPAKQNEVVEALDYTRR